MTSLDSFRCCKTLKVGSKTYAYYSLPTAEKNGLKGISRLPFSMKVLLENLLRNEDGRSVTKDDILSFAQWLEDRRPPTARSRSVRRANPDQDFTGVPAVVDLAVMRDAMTKLGGEPEEDQPARPGRPHLRSLRGGQFLRHQLGGEKERRGGIPPERRALRVPQVVAEIVRQFPRGAARLDQEGQAQGRR